MQKIAVPCISANGQIPQYQTIKAAGADVTALLSEPLSILPMDRVLIPTGLHLAIPDGYEAQVRPRSGLALKKGLTILNSPGTIDADYRGEIKIIVINLADNPVVIQNGERIAQIVFAPVVQADFTIREDLDPSERGSGGFGSTGV
jgi:dUTP pyrophosphatase